MSSEAVSLKNFLGNLRNFGVFRLESCYNHFKLVEVQLPSCLVSRRRLRCAGFGFSTLFLPHVSRFVQQRTLSLVVVVHLAVRTHHRLAVLHSQLPTFRRFRFRRHHRPLGASGRTLGRCCVTAEVRSTGASRRNPLVSNSAVAARSG